MTRLVPLSTLALVGRYWSGEGALPEPSGWQRLDVDVPDDTLGMFYMGGVLLPKVKEGDILVFVPAGTVRPGQVVLARSSSGQFHWRSLRRRRSRLWLAGFNPDYPPILVTDRVRILGRLVAHVGADGRSKLTLGPVFLAPGGDLGSSHIALAKTEEARRQTRQRASRVCRCRDCGR